jgi:hypothetical protein
VSLAFEGDWENNRNYENEKEKLDFGVHSDKVLSVNLNIKLISK